MSRSYRKTHIFGNSTSESEKKDKKIWHGAYRAANRNSIHHGLINNDFDNRVVVVPNDVMCSSSLSKDGKHYWSEKKMLMRVAEGRVDMRYIQKIMCK